MLENLIGEAQKMLGGELQSKTNLPNETLSSCMNLAQGSIVDGLKTQLLSGNISGIMDLFGGKSPISLTNPIVSGIASNFVESQVTKLGISENIAKMISTTAIPFILNLFAKNTEGKLSTDNLLGFLSSSKEEDAKTKDKDDNDSMLGNLKDNIMGKISGLFS